MTTRLILLGGFLGAGKTTLLAQATSRLTQRGRRVGLITNDQAADLVDTAILQAAKSPVEEISGGCFCCRFGELVDAMDRLCQSKAPDILLAEPVGSCTDLSATVLQPLKEHYGERFQLAPFSVLVDVQQVRTLERLRASFQANEAARFPAEVMYIYQKQLEEADLIVLNKADLLSAAELAEVEAVLRRHFTQAPILTVSALRGDGVDAWLDYVLGNHLAGQTITEVDYDQYADGEAALGWLNASVQLHAAAPLDWQAFCLILVEAVQQHCQKASAEIAHLKLHLSLGDHAIVANLTSNAGRPSLRGTLSGVTGAATLLLNVRANLDPVALRALVEKALSASTTPTLTLHIEHLASFAPSRPQPVHRYAQVIPAKSTTPHDGYSSRQN